MSEFNEVSEAHAIAAAQVPVAAELLDVIHPDWFRTVNPDALVMDSLDRCVLGQLYGSFEDGYNAVVAPRGTSHQFLGYAFSAHALDADWRREIQQRRSIVEATS